jgi:hypothetical protein
MVPVCVVFGAGLAGSVTLVSSPSTSGFPSETRKTPLVMEVEPDFPDSDAVQVLERASAVRISWPDVLRFATLAEEVTDPVAPVVPWVLTFSAFELNSVAGPYRMSDVASVPVTGVAEPVVGSVTVGLGPKGGCCPPKRVMLAETPKALPLTAVTSAVAAGPNPMPVRTAERTTAMTAQMR